MADFRITSPGSPLFFLEGELDAATVPLLDAAISEAVARGGPITLDVSNLTFADSTGISAILRASSAMTMGCVLLHGVRDGILRLIELMGVGQAPNVHVLPCAAAVLPAGSSN
jgi:anti-anti-sigma factor